MIAHRGSDHGDIEPGIGELVSIGVGVVFILASAVLGRNHARRFPPKKYRRHRETARLDISLGL